MKTYKVETTHVTKKYASVIIEAENERQAIEKARSMELSEFDETETSEQTIWEIKNGHWNVFGIFSFLYRS